MWRSVEDGEFYYENKKDEVHIPPCLMWLIEKKMATITTV